MQAVTSLHFELHNYTVLNLHNHMWPPGGDLWYFSPGCKTEDDVFIIRLLVVNTTHVSI